MTLSSQRFDALKTMNKTLAVYQQHLGASFSALPPEVQSFHTLQGKVKLRGQVTVIGAQTWAGRLLSLLMRFPAHSPDQPFEFLLAASPVQEHWQRRFPTRTMESRMCLDGDFLIEAFGPMRARFVLKATPQALHMEPRGIRFFGLPLPAFMLPRVQASERGAGNKLYFDVSVRWPGKHLVVAYQGHLDLNTAEAFS